MVYQDSDICLLQFVSLINLFGSNDYCLQIFQLVMHSITPLPSEWVESFQKGLKCRDWKIFKNGIWVAMKAGVEFMI